MHLEGYIPSGKWPQGKQHRKTPVLLISSDNPAFPCCKKDHHTADAAQQEQKQGGKAGNSPVMKIPDPPMQDHHEASAKAPNLRRHHPQSVQLMITISREIQKQSVLLFLSLHVKGNVREDRHKLYEHYRGKNAPKWDLRHRHLTTGSLYEQAQGGKDIQEQGTL